jgi:hypothetical protein
MSIYDDDELGNLNVVRFETQLGTSKVRFRTPAPPGCKVTLDLGEGRPREWDERKGPGMSGAFLAPKGPGLASGTLTIEYFAEDANERERLRAEHNDFLEMVGSPIPGNPEKKFIINHPMCMMMSPPMTECVFLNDPPSPHDDTTGKDTCVWKIKESRKQAPTISSTTAPGGATREGQSIDKYEAEQQAKLAEYESLAAEAGLSSAGP